MGKYLNIIKGKHIGISFREKCASIENAGGVRIDTPEEFIPNLVCVVDNGFFAAAGYAYCEEEMEHFKHTNGRPFRWYVLENISEYAE